jgi:hypothetical protein
VPDSPELVLLTGVIARVIRLCRQPKIFSSNSDFPTLIVAGCPRVEGPATGGVLYTPPGRSKPNVPSPLSEEAEAGGFLGHDNRRNHDPRAQDLISRVWIGSHCAPALLAEAPVREDGEGMPEFNIESRQLAPGMRLTRCDRISGSIQKRQCS